MPSDDQGLWGDGTVVEPKPVAPGVGRTYDDFRPATWRVEYMPPGGAWTLLARETVVPDTSDSFSRDYQTPIGALGTWRMRVIPETSEMIVGVSTRRSVLKFTDTVSGKCNSKYKRSYRFPLHGTGPWDIRVRRITEDGKKANIRNDLWWDSLAEIVESKLSYPNSAIIGAKVDAEQFSDIPSRGYEVFGIKCQIPSNYDPLARTYTGVWNGSFKVAWTNNPAWIYYDLLTNKRYGLGQYVDAAAVDKWNLYEIARYCDEMVPSGYGYSEPRFTCNTFIQTREEARRLITNLASVFRGMTYWSSGMVTAVADMPAEPVAIFTNANVVDGEFTYTSSSRGVRHTVALVTWNDPEDRYRQKVEYVEDRTGISKYGVNQTEVVAFGCTSRGQAHRLGKWILWTELVETDMVAFKTGLEGVTVFPGAVIKVADTLRSGDRIGGRSLHASAISLTLDAPIELIAGQTYEVSVVLPSGKVETRAVSSQPGETRVIDVVTPFSEIPQKHSMWVMASTKVVPQLFRVLSVSEAADSQVEVTALRYNPKKYASVERGVYFEEPNYTTIGKPTAPTNLAATDTLYLQGPSLVGTKLHFSWEGSAVRYNVRWRQGDGNFQQRESLSADIEIAPILEGPTALQVQSVDVLGRRSDWATLDYVVIGKTAPPGDVVGLTVRKRQSDLLIEWNAQADIDLAGYEIRVGPSWDAGEVLTTKFTGTTLVHDQSEAGTYYYHARAIDTSGNYSANVATFKLVLVPPVPVTLFDCVQAGDRIEFRWAPNPERDIAYYELREGVEWGFSTLLGRVSATSFSVQVGQPGVRNFLIKAVGYPGVYAHVATFLNTSVAQPSDRNVVWSADMRSLNYPGSTHGVEFSNGALVMSDGVDRAEYLFGIDLGVSYRATLTASLHVDAIKHSVSWFDANFTWSSAEAKSRAWVDVGDQSSAWFEMQFAQLTGLTPGEVDGWLLDGTMSSVGGALPVVSEKVSYGEGRYNKGLFVGDATRAAWDVSIPAVFRHSFWFAPSLSTDVVVMRMITGAGALVVRYSHTRKRLVLEDPGQNNVELVATFDVGTQYLIVVAQTTEERKLAVSSMSGAFRSIASEPLPPLGPISRIEM